LKISLKGFLIETKKALPNYSAGLYFLSGNAAAF
jgi:hypothetical protein